MRSGTEPGQRESCDAAAEGDAGCDAVDGEDNCACRCDGWTGDGRGGDNGLTVCGRCRLEGEPDGGRRRGGRSGEHELDGRGRGQGGVDKIAVEGC